MAGDDCLAGETSAAASALGGADEETSSAVLASRHQHTDCILLAAAEVFACVVLHFPWERSNIVNCSSHNSIMIITSFLLFLVRSTHFFLGIVP